MLEAYLCYNFDTLWLRSLTLTILMPQTNQRLHVGSTSFSYHLVNCQAADREFDMRECIVTHAWVTIVSKYLHYESKRVAYISWSLNIKIVTATIATILCWVALGVIVHGWKEFCMNVCLY